MIRRNGAKPGDLVFVSGTIGDAGAGLAVLQNKLTNISSSDRDALVSRYLLPQPRVVLGSALRGKASAALDVSDGLMADLGHISETSKVRLSIDADRIPLSEAARNTGVTIPLAVVAGDDYEIAFTASAARRTEILSLGAESGIAEIGRVEAGSGVALLDSSGREIPLSGKGYRHF
jgi:thiamine-monophosphate kinase